MVEENRLPQHVAIIVDGNGRWAKARSLYRIRGHESGADTVRSIITESRHLGIGCLTLYTFSAENWNRGRREVDFLMKLLGKFIDSELGLMMEKDIRFMVSGDLSRLPGEVLKKVNSTIKETCENQSMILNLALSYGSRQEILEAISKIFHDLQSGELKPEDVLSLSQEKFSNYLYTAGLPDPDLMIRTGGELRVSNFLLWQMAYTEFYFASCYWPDFGEQAFALAIKEYQNRKRRFGLSSNQLLLSQSEDA